MKEWHWLKGGLALGLVSLLAVILVKPIGVSTQYVIADGILWNLASERVVERTVTAEGETVYSSPNAYLDKSGGKYAENVANPLNYSFIFVLSMIGGAFLASRLGGNRPSSREKDTPAVWEANFGHTRVRRYTYAFLGGVLVLFGARLAGGCTSGHMISGIGQTAVSGFLFTAAVFATAIPTALAVYRKS